jgi:hypothetical protein
MIFEVGFVNLKSKWNINERLKINDDLINLILLNKCC